LREKKKIYAGSETFPYQLRKRRHIGPKCRVPPPPKEKRKLLEGGWQPPAPDRDLESNSFFQMRVVAVRLRNYIVSAPFPLSM